MSLAVVRSRAPAAGRAPEVTVEVHLANGLPSFSIVGLPDLEVRESRERVRAALGNCGFDFPVRRITVNLAPADLPKESGRFDLPIALGILAASGQLPVTALAHREFAGELSLTGAVRPMRGAFAMACGTARAQAEREARAELAAETPVRISATSIVGIPHDDESRAHPGATELYLPAQNAAEAALVPGVVVYGAADLRSLCAHLAGADPGARLAPVRAAALDVANTSAVPDMADVIGQRGARRALEVAAAGGHHLLMLLSKDPKKQMRRPMADVQPKPRAYSYLRFSTPEQTKGDSFSRQARMALEYAARNGLELDESLTFHDLGVSAYRGLNAEAGRLAEFLEAVRAGLVPKGSYLLVEALDRLSRLTPRKAVRVLEDIVEEGITVVTLNDGRAYTAGNLDSDPTSLLIAIVYFMRANEESATKSRRLKSAWEAKRGALADKPLTSLVPAWIRLDQETNKLELIPDRAAIVERIFEMQRGGTGVALIASTLNREGVPCFGGAAHWHRTYIRKILSNPATVGTFIPHRLAYLEGKRTRIPLDPVPGYYPAVVSEELYSSAQRQAETPAKHRAGQVVNLLAGLAKCPKCGSTMTRVNKGSPTKAGKPKLVCTRAKAGAGCEYRSVTLEDVEGAILGSAGYLAGSAPTGAEGIDQELADTEQAIAVTKESVESLVSVLATTPSRAIAAKLAELETALEELEVKRDGLAEQAIAASGPLLVKRLGELEGALTAEPLDIGKANAMLRTMLESITVDYETGSLELQWKQGGVSSLTYAWAG